MTIEVTYTLQNTNSEYEVVDLGFPDPLTTLQGIYGNRDWSFDLVFSGIDSETDDPITITSIQTTTPDYVLFSSSGNTVTLYKNPEKQVFPGEQYKFVKFSTQEEYVYENLADVIPGLSIIAWDTPPQKVITASYVFVITYNIPIQGLINQTTTKTLSQDLYWDFTTGFAKLQEQVTISEK